MSRILYCLICSLHNFVRFSSDLSIVCADPKTGKVHPDDVVSLLRPTTRLVSVMLAQNETGVVQPVRELVAAIRQWEAQGKGGGGRVYVHTDAAQVR